MSGVQSFRSAMGGFNREDVVRYIEYINNKHISEIEQLNTQRQSARESLAQAKAEAEKNAELKAQLEAVQARCAELEAQQEEANARYAELEEQKDAAQTRCTELEAQLEQAAQAEPEVQEEVPAKKAEDELEFYRRAERAERLARDRAAQIYNQANAALADATVKVEEVSDELSTLAEQLTAQALDAKIKLQEAVASMYAIRPDGE